MNLAEILAGVGGQQPANQGMAPFLNQWMQQQGSPGQPDQFPPQMPQMGGMMGGPQSGMSGFGGMGDIAKLLSATGTY